MPLSPTDSFAMDVSIVMPTLGRMDFVLQNVAALNAGNFAGTLIIADSSPREVYEAAAESIGKIAPKFPVLHLHTQGARVFDATSRAATKVKTPFVVWCGDDDFLVPRSLAKAAAFLTEHPDFSTVTGVNLALNIRDGKVESSSEYNIYTIDDDLPSERIHRLFDAYSVVHLAVTRTECFQLCVAPQAPSLKDKFLSAEIMWNTLFVIAGKVGSIDSLLLVRSIHDRRPIYDSQLLQMTDPDWAVSATSFLDYASGILTAREDITTERARQVLAAGYSKYLAVQLTNEARRSPPAPAPQSEPTSMGSLTDRIRNLIKSTPLLNAVMRELRAWARQSAGRPLLTLDELLRGRSPFHDDFIPIYQAITAWNPARDFTSGQGDSKS